MAREATIVRTTANSVPNVTIPVSVGAGTGRAVFVVVHNYGGTIGTSASGVTYNGVALTQLASATNAGLGRTFTVWGGMVADGAVATPNVVVTFSASNATFQVFTSSYSGMTSVRGGYANGTGTGTAPTVTATTVSGDLVVVMGFDGQFNGGTLTATAPASIVASETPNSQAWQIEQSATGTSTTVAGTLSGGSAWIMGAIVLVPAATGPTINTQPSNQTVTAPATATFTVAATASSGSLTYQWQVNTGSGFTNVSTGTGGTTASYTTPATSGSMNGYTYQCIVTDSGGSVTSSTATLTVNVTPSVTTNPSNQSVVTPTTATFTAAATGTPTPTVQWQRSTNSGSTWADISGATSTSYTTPATAVTGGSANNGDQYRAVFTNAGGTATTTAATLTVNASGTAPAVTTHPSNQTVAAGATASFTAAFSGTPTPTVQWQVSTNGGTSFSNVAGATSLTYSFATVVGDNAKQFRCVATNASGSATTNAATLTVTSYSATVGPFFRNTGDAVPITTSVLYSVFYSTLGALTGYTPTEGTVTPNVSTGVITLTGLPIAGPCTVLLMTPDGTAVGYQRATAA